MTCLAIDHPDVPFTESEIEDSEVAPTPVTTATKRDADDSVMDDAAMVVPVPDIAPVAGVQVSWATAIAIYAQAPDVPVAAYPSYEVPS